MCNSCKKSYNGTNGNGYQPCSCSVPIPPERPKIRTMTSPFGVWIEVKSKKPSLFSRLFNRKTS